MWGGHYCPPSRVAATQHSPGREPRGGLPNKTHKPRQGRHSARGRGRPRHYDCPRHTCPARGRAGSIEINYPGRACSPERRHSIAPGRQPRVDSPTKPTSPGRGDTFLHAGEGARATTTYRATRVPLEGERAPLKSTTPGRACSPERRHSIAQGVSPGWTPQQNPQAPAGATQFCGALPGSHSSPSPPPFACPPERSEGALLFDKRWRG